MKGTTKATFSKSDTFKKKSMLRNRNIKISHNTSQYSRNYGKGLITSAPFLVVVMILFAIANWSLQWICHLLIERPQWFLWTFSRSNYAYESPFSVSKVFSLLIQQERKHVNPIEEEKVVTQLAKPYIIGHPFDLEKKYYSYIESKAQRYAPFVINRVIPLRYALRSPVFLCILKTPHFSSCY